jgi:hypothetical protein
VLHWLREAAAATPSQSQRTSVAASEDSPRLALGSSRRKGLAFDSLEQVPEVFEVRWSICYDRCSPTAYLLQTQLDRRGSDDSAGSGLTVVDTNPTALRPASIALPSDMPAFTLPPVQVDMLSMLSAFAVVPPSTSPISDSGSAFETAV